MREKYIQDTRIHCCLFFINPTGHSLKPVGRLELALKEEREGVRAEGVNELEADLSLAPSFVLHSRCIDRRHRHEEALRGCQRRASDRQIGLVDSGGEGCVQGEGELRPFLPFRFNLLSSLFQTS